MGNESARDDWRNIASCRQGSGYDPELWFPAAKTGSAAHIEQAQEPKSICREFCPVRSECLAWALESGQEFGIAGGFDEYERRRLRQKKHRRDQVLDEAAAAAELVESEQVA